MQISSDLNFKPNSIYIDLPTLPTLCPIIPSKDEILLKKTPTSSHEKKTGCMVSVGSNFNFLCGRPHGAYPLPLSTCVRMSLTPPLPCGRHKWMDLIPFHMPPVSFGSENCGHNGVTLFMHSTQHTLTHPNTHIHTQTHANLHTNTHTHTVYTYMHASTFTHTHTHTHTRTHAHTRTYTHIHLQVRHVQSSTVLAHKSDLANNLITDNRCDGGPDVSRTKPDPHRIWIRLVDSSGSCSSFFEYPVCA